MLMSLFSFTFCSLFIFLLIRTHYNIKLLSYIKAKGDLNETKYKLKIVHHRSSNVNIRESSQVISYILPFTEDDLNENDFKKDLKDTPV